MMESKSALFSNCYPKISHSSFYLNRDFSKLPKKLHHDWATFVRIFFHQDLSKIAQSGHTGYHAHALKVIIHMKAFLHICTVERNSLFCLKTFALRGLGGRGLQKILDVWENLSLQFSSRNHFHLRDFYRKFAPLLLLPPKKVNGIFRSN